MKNVFRTFLWVIYPTLSCAGMEVLEDDVDIMYETWCAPSKQIEVTRVYDGDTFVYLDNGEEKKIRMLGVDAPEIGGTPETSDCYGEEATSFLRELLLGQEVVLEFDMECVDMFQRTLSWIVLRGDDPQVLGWMEESEMIGLNDDGSYEVLVNELLVQLGYATVFRGEVDESVRYSDRMSLAEENAESRNVGLWANCP